jgi:hypothetical protein
VSRGKLLVEGQCCGVGIQGQQAAAYAVRNVERQSVRDLQESGTGPCVRGTECLVDSEARDLQSGHAGMVLGAQGKTLPLLGFKHDGVSQ